MDQLDLSVSIEHKPTSVRAFRRARHQGKARNGKPHTLHFGGRRYRCRIHFDVRRHLHEVATVADGRTFSANGRTEADALGALVKVIDPTVEVVKFA